jgi:hypothetical protein
MEAVIRPARPEEMEQYGTLAAYVYAGRYGDTADNLMSRSMHPDWTLCAFVDGRMVAAHSTLREQRMEITAAARRPDYCS